MVGTAGVWRVWEWGEAGQGGGEVSIEDKSIPSGMAEVVCENK